jgi:hypothetical protein
MLCDFSFLRQVLKAAIVKFSLRASGRGPCNTRSTTTGFFLDHAALVSGIRFLTS